MRLVVLNLCIVPSPSLRCSEAGDEILILNARPIGKVLFSTSQILQGTIFYEKSIT